MSEEFKVIDWQEAMDQCGDDEEFLRELLSDLQGEIDAQLVKIEDALKVSRCGQYHWPTGCVYLLTPKLFSLP